MCRESIVIFSSPGEVPHIDPCVPLDLSQARNVGRLLAIGLDEWKFGIVLYYVMI